jgi:hypothetical protein
MFCWNTIQFLICFAIKEKLVYKSVPWTPGRQCLICYYWVEWFVQFSKALKSIANTAHIKITNTQHCPEKGEAWTFFGKGSGFNNFFFSSNISMYTFANTLHQNKMLLSRPANKTVTLSYLWNCKRNLVNNNNNLKGNIIWHWVAVITLWRAILYTYFLEQ